jgi:hypothetical protein
VIITFEKEVKDGYMASYFKLKRGKVWNTKEVLPWLFVDVDKKNRVLGIEVISFFPPKEEEKK